MNSSSLAATAPAHRRRPLYTPRVPLSVSAHVGARESAKCVQERRSSCVYDWKVCPEVLQDVIWELSAAAKVYLLGVRPTAGPIGSKLAHSAIRQSSLMPTHVLTHAVARQGFVDLTFSEQVGNGIREVVVKVPVEVYWKKN